MKIHYRAFFIKSRHIEIFRIIEFNLTYVTSWGHVRF